MYKNKKILAVIPARGGSKGIPQKNIYSIYGKPLISFTINQSLQSKYLDRVIVSTDCEKIAQISESLGVAVPFLRPRDLATDSAKTISTMVHVIELLKSRDEEYDYVVLLQPTQPLRTSDHIDEAIEQIIHNDQSTLVSVSKVKDHPLLIRSIGNEGSLKKLIKENSTVRRQDFEDYYKVNGAIYINKIDKSFNEELSLNDNQWPYIMDSKFDLDIDCMEDIEIFKRVLNSDA
ncbi:acylneuraminate cytidylyltransferase family protein [Paenisporosarcina quisquiliarum]|uniref:Acylneuraminate cytidylyltransferase family protein n=1 Tax=Paenisporosarcina quisquiliarum TaxID=365346 RepID=A0A9X3LI70_9BACL|nr:acylneuraminate cytidylyltransferase family protein [Paenisporosarcina quisquiliarum]MCZ8536934.1 acylneuraminate cytidylyltransferase family protein [Paenisporosarcina quisquiliarum]